jgi:uncharacterized protein
MNSCAAKILFFHGLDSTRESTKFHAIDAEQKFCINVDYRNLSFQAATDFFNEIIEKIKPEILVGHCVGGYWALKMSISHCLPCIVANPNLSPNFRDDYPIVSHADLDHDIPQLAYIELGDEVLNMHATQEQLENYMQVETYHGGHHGLEKPENLNELIHQIAHSI